MSGYMVIVTVISAVSKIASTSNSGQFHFINFTLMPLEKAQIHLSPAMG